MTKNKIILGFLVAVLSLTAFLPTSVAAHASAPNERGADNVTESIDVSRAHIKSVNTYSLKTVNDRNVNSYRAVAVTVGSRSLGNVGRVINGEVYIPIRRFVESLVSGAVVSYDSASRTVSVSGGGHNISVSDGAYALYASGRVFFDDTPSRILSDGRMYVPVSNIARAFSLSFKTASSGVTLSGALRAVKSGSEFYDADIVYWLSRIISAESRGEPLIGQIAVGNVVLNRVRSKEFPNTVWGVIFDRKYGVQFSPVINGSVYDEPAASSILAAKICLDGFTVSDSALYFLRPSASSSSWIVNNRPFLFVIGNHYFFS